MDNKKRIKGATLYKNFHKNNQGSHPYATQAERIKPNIKNQVEYVYEVGIKNTTSVFSFSVEEKKVRRRRRKKQMSNEIYY